MMASGIRDFMFMIGMALVAVGLGLWSVPLMFVVVGGILMGLALVAAWRGRS